MFMNSLQTGNCHYRNGLTTPKIANAEHRASGPAARLALIIAVVLMLDALIIAPVIAEQDEAATLKARSSAKRSRRQVLSSALQRPT
jgi:hypothetical protein